MAANMDLLKSRIRGYLLSCSDSKEPLDTFNDNYNKVNRPIDYKQYGFNSVLALMRSIPDVVHIVTRNGVTMLYGLKTAESRHITDMISKQKKPRKRVKASGIFPRYRSGGARSHFSRPSQPPPRNATYPKPPQPNVNHRPMPVPQQQRRPLASRSSPSLYSTKAKQNNTAPRFANPPQYNPPQYQPPQHNPSQHHSPQHNPSQRPQQSGVFNRLGPTPEKKESVTRHVTISNYKENERPNTQSNRPPIKPVPDKQPVKEPIKIEIPPPTPPNNTTIVLVDTATSDGSVTSIEDCNDKFFPSGINHFDPEFLRYLVRHFLAMLVDVHRRTFTPLGIASRMRRKLSRVNIDVPSYVVDLLVSHMSREWSDIFDYEEPVEPDTNTEFYFTEPLKIAYSIEVRRLPKQAKLPKERNTHRVRLSSVASNHFFVTLWKDTFFEEYEKMESSLEDDINEADDILTYRTNEICVALLEYKDASGNKTERYARGQLMSFSINSSVLDDSNNELSLTAEVFLVDSGDSVNIPVSNLFPLPRKWFDLPPRAYRCNFFGGSVIKPDAFANAMRTSFDTILDLYVVGYQRTDTGLVIQAKLCGNSYIFDDLSRDKIISKVIVNEPDPKPWPLNEDLLVCFVDWYAGYRSVLVRRSGKKDMEELDYLEGVRLNELEIENAGVSKPLIDNIYIWRLHLDDEWKFRRVRCLALPNSENKTMVLCLDHGCRCMVKPGELFLPQRKKVMKAFAGTPFFATALPLAMVPENLGQHDLMQKKKMKQKVRSLCPAGRFLFARHDTSVSEKPAFILHGTSNVSLHFNLNLEFLKIFMDIKNWEVGQLIKACFMPVSMDEMVLLGVTDASLMLWSIRFDENGCSPDFSVPVKEMRFMENCMADFTDNHKGTSNTILQRLVDYPSEILGIDTMLVYRNEKEFSGRVVRVQLKEEYCGGHSRPVNVSLFDNPVRRHFIDSVRAEHLYTIPKEGIGNRPIDRKLVDVSSNEARHFMDLLQNLPSFDQLVLTTDNATTVAIKQQLTGRPIYLEVTHPYTIGQFQFPVVKLSSLTLDTLSIH